MRLLLPTVLAVALPLAARAAPPILYVALGDSTAAGIGAERGGGYPERLARRLGESGTQVRLLNLGAPGATAEDVRRAQLPRVLAEHPALVTIGIGLNDVMRGRPLAEFARDLEVIADGVARAKAAVVISELPDVSRALRRGLAALARAEDRRVQRHHPARGRAPWLPGRRARGELAAALPRASGAVRGRRVPPLRARVRALGRSPLAAHRAGARPARAGAPPGPRAAAVTTPGVAG